MTIVSRGLNSINASEVRRRNVTFGSFQLCSDSGHLLENGQIVPLGHRAVEILMLLVRRAGEVVRHEEIVACAWPDTVVEENNLRVQISAIRKALSNQQDFSIQNIPGRGYRFNGYPRKRDECASVERLETVMPISSSASPIQAGLDTPSTLSPLVGRETDIRALIDIATVNRCTTVIGCGGIGKTSLVREVSRRLEASFSDGVCCVRLLGHEQDAELASCIADALGLREQCTDHWKWIGDFLYSRECLLVIDNCEHVITGVGHLVAELLTLTSRLSVLATSRAPLRIPGEQIYRLAPLAYLQHVDRGITLEKLLAFPAAVLFIERAQAKTRGFHLTPSDAPALAVLLAKLEGVPLAIELAAARIQSLGLLGLTQKIDNYLPLLIGGKRSASQRQQTLKMTLDWSFSLLSDQEKRALMAISIFTGAFTSDAAVQVATGPLTNDHDVIRDLASLVEKSLILAERHQHITRYRMHQATRSYASDRLKHDPMFAEVRSHYVNFVLKVIVDATPQGLADESEQHDAYPLLLCDVRQVLTWMLAEDGDNALGMVLLSKAHFLWFHLGLFDDFIDLSETIIRRAEAGAGKEVRSEAFALVLAFSGLAIFHVHGPILRMREVLERALCLAKVLQCATTTQLILRGLWACQHASSQYAQSIHTCAQFSTAARPMGSIQDDNTRNSDVLPTLALMKGATLLYKGHLRHAHRYLEFAHVRSHPYFDAYLNQGIEVQSVIETAFLARICWLKGEIAAAFSLAMESYNLARAAKRPAAVTFALALAVCPIHLWSGRVESVTEYVDELGTLAKAHALQHWVRYFEIYQSTSHYTAHQSPRILAPDALHEDWAPTHIEEFSVLPGGVIPLSFVTRAKSMDPIWCSAEVLRRFAMAEYRASGPASTAQSVIALNKSRAIAKKQGALSWELRASLSLAEIFASQDKTSAARATLMPLLDRFHGNVATDDLANAHALLQTL